MVDTRAVAHEVQEQLLTAMHRGQQQLRKGQEQFRKSQDQLRKGQEQFRKGREAVNTAIRTGNELAKAVRPNIPPMPGKGMHLPPLGTLTSPAKLRAQAQEFAGQVAARQRDFADKALHVATPLVTDGVARLNHVVSSLLAERDREHAEPLAPPAVAGTEEKGAVAEGTAPKTPQATAEADAAKPAKPKAAPAKPKTSAAKPKTAPAKAKTASTTKARGTKAQS